MMRKGAPARVMTVPGRKEGRTSGLDALRAQQPVRTFRRPAAFRLRFAVRHGRRPRAWRIVARESTPADRRMRSLRGQAATRLPPARGERETRGVGGEGGGREAGSSGG